MKTGKTYHIDTLEKFLNVVSIDNYEDIMKDFNSWVSYYIQFVDELRKAKPELLQDKSNTEIAEGTFEWVDDGSNEIKGIRVEDTKTGEVLFHSIENHSKA